jgi:hypothetical protein
MPKMRFKFVCILLIVLFAAFPCFVSSQGVDEDHPQLSFSAKPTKQSLHEGEKVTFTFQLRNEDSKDVLVSPALILGYDIILDIKDSSGKSIPWCGVITQWVHTGKKLIFLQPGKSLIVSRQVSCDDQRQEGYSLLAPATYTATAKYSVPVAPDGTASDLKKNAVVRGPYFAKSVEFTIVATGRAK